ncbi:MAG: glycosyltransferase [Bryobacteraceae bacterium]
MALTVIAVFPLAIWLYLFFGRGGFWRVRRHFATAGSTPGTPVRVVAVVPARDEASVVGEAVQSLLDQRLLCSLQVVLIDDGSSDGTAALAAQTAKRMGAAQRLTIIQGKPLPSGWTGKLWAVSQGIEAARQFDADYYLLTDADIRHHPESIGRLLNVSQGGGYDLASYMVKLSVETLAEKFTIPAFVYFFFQLYPPSWIASRRHGTAGAAGGCMLIRPAALERAGGIAAIRNALIDDCALAQVIKKTGGQVWLGLTEESQSIRSYGGFRGVGQMISRSAFHQLRHSTLLLLMTIAGLATTYVVPLLLLLTGKPLPMLLGGAVWVLMTLSYAPTVRFYGRPALWSLSLPLVAIFYAGCTIHSAYRFWTGAGGKWKGRTQDKAHG